MKKVPAELRRGKQIDIAVSDVELEQLATLAKWYFKGEGELGETETKPRKRKGVGLLARLMVNNEIQRMMAEMQANTTETETA
jgi:hypothetical protein